MSRIMGRMFDVYEISKLLKEANIKKYKSDKTNTSWESLMTSNEKYKMYLPESALNYLNDKKIRICKCSYNFQVDFEVKEEPLIKFPSLVCKEEYKKGLAFFLGFILNNYHNDLEGTYFTYNFEYNETLPLLIEYLYCKEINKENEFYKKYLYLLRTVAINYLNDYKNYNNFQDFKKSFCLDDLTDREYDLLMSYSMEADDEMECAVSEALIQLASYDGVLEIVEKYKTKEELKNVIEKLFLNESNDRSSLLHSMDINSYGFNSLRNQLKKR